MCTAKCNIKMANTVNLIKLALMLSCRFTLLAKALYEACVVKREYGEMVVKFLYLKIKELSWPFTPSTKIYLVHLLDTDLGARRYKIT